MNQPAVALPRIASLYQAVQRDRVGLERSLATKPDVHDPEAQAILGQLIEIEQRAVNYLNVECAKSAVWPWLTTVKGIGPRLAGMLIGLIDIQKAPTISSLWRFAGLAVIGGEAERRTKGVKLHYCAPLKKTMFLVERSFILAAVQPYETTYRESKAYYTANRPDWTPKHADLAARRRMVKLFMSHLWLKWREAEGLPISEPYAMRLPGHGQGYIAPPTETTARKRPRKPKAMKIEQPVSEERATDED